MSISIACTQCGTTIKAPDEAAGKKGRCPKCKAVILIPELDDFVEPDEDFVEPEPESFETETLPTPAQDSVGFVKIKDNVAGEYGLDEGDEFERQHRMQEKRREADQSYDDSRERRRKEVRPHRGLVILGLGVLSIITAGLPLLCWILAAIALSKASDDGPQMERGLMDKSGQGLTTVGQICSYLGIILGLGGCVLIAMYLNSLIR